MIHNNKKSVYAVILAAGAASRFGSAKQLAELDGIPLVRRVMTVARQSCGSRSLLVAGHEWRAVVEVAATQGFIVINDRHESGIGSSLAMAVAAVRHVAAAIIVTLADQPLVTAEHIAALIAEWSGDSHEIVATSYAATSGPPVLFAAGCFNKLLALDGDTGARALLSDNEFKLRTVTFEDAGIDVDTTEDLARIARNAHS